MVMVWVNFYRLPGFLFVGLERRWILLIIRRLLGFREIEFSNSDSLLFHVGVSRLPLFDLMISTLGYY